MKYDEKFFKFLWFYIGQDDGGLLSLESYLDAAKKGPLLLWINISTYMLKNLHQRLFHL